MITLKNIVDVGQIRNFGTQIEDVYTKKGTFSKKVPKVWVAFRGEDEYHIVSDAKLSDIKNMLKESGYSWNVEMHEKESWTNRKGKEKTEHIWKFSVVTKGEVKLNTEQMKRLLNANQNGTMFTPDGYRPWYFIIDSFFKRYEDDSIVFLDKENYRVIETGYTPFTCKSEDVLREWTEKFLQS